MSSFTGPLKVEILPRGSKNRWRVAETFTFHVGAPGSNVFIRCEEGFETDLTSIPPGLRWLISPSDPDLAQAACTHDAAYRRGTWTIKVGDEETQQPLNRAAADGLMLEAMIARDVPRWKRNLVYSGLVIGGGFAWKSWAEKRGSVRTETTK